MDVKFKTFLIREKYKLENNYVYFCLHTNILELTPKDNNKILSANNQGAL